jgi:outer membrane protein assembly factor BamE (lipoprotein component of BamABCDE complex)
MLLSIGVLLLLIALGCAIAGNTITSEAANGIREGMTRSEIVQIAGEPHRDQGNWWYYNVRSGLAIYSDMLKIEFDQNGFADWVSY